MIAAELPSFTKLLVGNTAGRDFNRATDRSVCPTLSQRRERYAMTGGAIGGDGLREAARRFPLVRNWRGDMP